MSSSSRVEVRRGRHGLELRVDGTLASVVREGQDATGPVWDAIAAPLLLLPEERRRSVLILGLGAGSVARTLRAAAPRALIVGVELDGDVLQAARAHFGLDTLRVEAVQADALEYLNRERRVFDVVIEDLFIGPNRNIHKPPALFTNGYRDAFARVAPSGLFVSNTIHEGPRVFREMDRAWPGLLCIGARDYYNRVYVGGPRGLDASSLRASLQAHEVLREHLPELSLRTLKGRA